LSIDEESKKFGYEGFFAVSQQCGSFPHLFGLWLKIWLLVLHSWQPFSYGRMKRKNSLLPMYQQPMATASRFRLSKRSTLIAALALFLSASLIINYFVVFTKPSHISYAIADPIPDPPHPTLTSLIMVPGHAIYHGEMNESDLNNDEGWTLEGFQKGGQIKVFMNHIKKGIELLQEDEKALLVMSG
jgi:hypothetical protein